MMGENCIVVKLGVIALSCSFANWPSSRNFGWNSRDIGQKRDVIQELADAFRKDEKVKFGLYHSLFEWYNPLYLQVNKCKETSKVFY